MSHARKALTAATCAVLLFSSAQSAAESVHIAGVVPVLCHAQILGGGGGLDEVCNNPGGYAVWIDYPASLAGDALIVDGQRFELSEAGTVRIAQESGPHVRHRSLSLEGDPDAAGQLQARVETASPV